MAIELFLSGDQSLNMDRSGPEALKISKGFLGLRDLQVDAIMAVDEVELAAVLVVGILHQDHGIAKVREALEELGFDLFEFARGDDVVAGLLVVLEAKKGPGPRRTLG
jgi:hypothetical protein